MKFSQNMLSLKKLIVILTCIYLVKKMIAHKILNGANYRSYFRIIDGKIHVIRC